MIDETVESTVAGDYINQYNEDDFFIKDLIVNKLFSIYKFTSKKGEAFFIGNFSLFPCYVYTCCLKARYKLKLKKKFVFIVLIYTTTK